jgi:DNA helicase II / ATP-dependent DNA helicase PcrA
MHHPDFDISQLTSAQRRAVAAPLASHLILAGPGTGKTRTLVHRIAHLISERAIAADAILAVTYTNKATEEMRARLRRTLPDAAARLSVGTFHSFCIRLLREHYEAVGLPKHFAISDEKGQVAALARVRPNAVERDIKRVLGALSAWRLDDETTRAPLSEFEDSALADYQAFLRKNALIDFDDILLLTERLLLDSPEALAACRARFRSVLIDEFQDTDAVQYRILRLLCLGPLGDAARADVIPAFAVADDDQSIFAWRGANPGNIRRFTAEFLPDPPDSHIIKLEENYRCSGAIVAAANRLLAETPRLFDKAPTAARAGGEPVSLRTYATAETEAGALADDIRDAHAAGVPFSDMAVLYRRHDLAPLVESTLLKRGVPCQVVRSASLFDVARVRRLIALMRALVNPGDDLALQAFLADMLDEPTRLRVEAFARHRAISLRAALWARVQSADADRLERRELSRVTGALSTGKTLAESDSARTLTEWVRAMDAYLASAPSGAPALVVADPLSIAPLEVAARWLERLAVRRGALIVAAGNPLWERAAVALLGETLGAEPFRIAACSAADAAPAAAAEVRVLLALDSAGEARAAGERFAAILVAPDFALGAAPANAARREIPPDCTPPEERGPRPSVFILLWKLAQAYLGLRLAPFLPNYTAVDIETTDLDVERNDVVEIAAVRVRDGAPVAEYATLVKPAVPISPNAQAVHHITPAMVATHPTFAEIARDVRDFLGDDILVAHNGLGFDFPILRRRMRECDAKLDNSLFDTLPLARQLYPDAKRATLEALAVQFDVSLGAHHRALDDTKTLARVFEGLKNEYARRRRCAMGIETLGALALAAQLELTPQEAAQSSLVRAGRAQWGDDASGRFYEQLRTLNETFPDPAFAQLSAAWDAALRERAERSASQEEVREAEGQARFLEAAAAFDARPILEGMREFLDFTRLFSQTDSWRERDAVTLMTLHAAKGLEFDRIWLPALEQNVLPSFQAVKDNSPRRAAKLQEERRLLYVGMTRARTHLTLSHALQRGGYPAQPSQFLADLGLDQ